ncbi:MAG: hypothetical protein R2828_32255 [Saprospiraceae bacterium]
MPNVNWDGHLTCDHLEKMGSHVWCSFQLIFGELVRPWSLISRSV